MMVIFQRARAREQTHQSGAMRRAGAEERRDEAQH
jgi:hypothetical protein